ncbi:unnamed protein product [Caenorhabditis auriculariae]|uniref:Choline/carnitine acyltransferase domain-containing protein n=1 Tax=Caenorhabditis auriculariae TaxID=2777116 RepID=A0A8S1HEG3_9PELO|nr:unnamed protein product [Caenorhabditis auriculariae]
MTTFAKQATLPSLPVPPLKDSLEKYVESANVLLSPEEQRRLRQNVDKFAGSELAVQLQAALEKKALNERNWLEEWWYDAYNEIREPLEPFVSFAALNSHFVSLEGSQLCRAADVLHLWARVWHKIRSEQWPVTASRGVVWDMSQFHNLLNSRRTPKAPKDVIERSFKTKSEGKCPSGAVVNCRGVLWLINLVDSAENVKSPDELYKVLDFIAKNSKRNNSCVSILTTSHRDTWAENRAKLIGISKQNEELLQSLEESVLVLTLADKSLADHQNTMRDVFMDESWYVWQDKSLNVVIYEDGQNATHGEHSNVDAIVVLQTSDEVATKVRKELWIPEDVDFEMPQRLDFELDQALRDVISEADQTFHKTKEAFRARVVHFRGYGNDKCRASKLYTDTLVQIALQLAFVKTHGFLAPIYETASTRKFFHGRTETVRGCTRQFSAFAKKVFENAPLTEQQKLFGEAVAAHNFLMEECMEGRGFDRHLFGLRKTLELFNRGCSPKRPLPEFLQDDTWTKAGGGGNFLLSTSLTGYMAGDELGAYGYVNAMRPDGYGCFYRIGKTRITVTVSDWKGSKSNIDAFCDAISWAFNHLESLLPAAPSKL